MLYDKEEKTIINYIYKYSVYYIRNSPFLMLFFTGRSEFRLSKSKESSGQGMQSNLQPHTYKMVSLSTPVT